MTAVFPFINLRNILEKDLSKSLFSLYTFQVLFFQMTRMGIPQDLWVPDNQEFLSDNINHIIPDEYLCVFNSSHSPGNGESCANSFTISPAHLAPDPALGIAPQPAKHSSTCPGYSGSMSAPFYQPSHTTDSSYEGSQVSSGVLSRSTCLTPPSCGCPEEMSEHQYQHQPLNTDNDQLANTPDVHPTQSSLPAYEYDSSASHFGMNAINTLEGFNGRNMVFTRNDAYLVDSNYGMSALEQYTYQVPYPWHFNFQSMKLSLTFKIRTLH